MRHIPYCLPQILDDVLATAKLVSTERFIHDKVIRRVLGEISGLDSLGDNPADLALNCLRAAYNALGVKDPYGKVKEQADALAKAALPAINALLTDDRTRLATTACLAAAASEVNYTSGNAVQLAAAINVNAQAPALDESMMLATAVTKAEKVMLILDKAGEVLLDCLLAGELAAKASQVTLVAASQPLLARALKEDVTAAALPENCQVITPGADMLGIKLEKASSEFQSAFKEADLVIAKGEINLQTLTGCDREIFYLLRFTCDECAKFVDCRSGDTAILLQPAAKQ